MTPRRRGTTWVPTVSQRWLTTVDITAALMGVLATLGAMAVMIVLLTSGDAGLEVLEASKFEQLVTSTVLTTIVVVSAAFFCGGWVYGALRGRRKPRRLGDRL